MRKRKSIKLAFIFIVLAATKLYGQAIQGVSPVYLNSTQTYTYTSTASFDHLWVITKGTKITESQNGLVYSVTVLWTSVGTGNIKIQEFTDVHGGATITRSSRNITINSCPVITAPTVNNGSRCGAGAVSLSCTAPGAGLDIRWYQTSVSTVVLGTGTSFTTPSISSTTTYYAAVYNIASGSCESGRTLATATVSSVSTANAGMDQLSASTCGLTSVTLSANTPTSGVGSWSIVSGSGGSFGNSSSATSTFSGVAGSTYTLRWTISNSPCTPSTDDVVITFNRNPTQSNAGTDQTGASTCALTTITLAANTPTVGVGSWSIVSGTGGSFGNASSATSTFSGVAGSAYTLRWTISNSPCSASTDEVIIIFNRNPSLSNAGADQTGTSTCGLTSVTLAATTPAVGTGAWSVVSGTGGSFGNASSATSAFSGVAGSTYTLRWTISNSSCTPSTDDVVIVFNRNATQSNAGADQTGTSTCGLTSVTLAANTPTVGSGAWSVVSGTGGSFGNSSSATSTFSGVAGSAYTLRWTINNIPCTSSADDVAVKYNTDIAFCVNKNLIVKNTFFVEGLTDLSTTTDLPITKKAQTIQYFDGLGRPIQSINKQASPNQKDIVQPLVYDAVGRETRRYLPYVNASASNGYYQQVTFDVTGNYTGVSGNTYANNVAGKIAQDSRPFSETILEASPLNRPLQDYGHGNDWGPGVGGSNKFVSHQYLINVHTVLAHASQEKVIAWKLDAGGLPIRVSAVSNYIEVGGYYSTGQLSIKGTIDEQGNAVREYTNRSGQVILKKVQAIANTTNLNSTADWALTYYIYDDIGNLRYVFQPELSRAIHTTDTYVVNANGTDLNNFAFQYKYDGRRRMIEKRVPGADWIYMVYDNRDRLVLTQDGIQRTPKQWTFTKYDALNRPILTGIYTHGTVVTQADMQTAVNLYYTNNPTLWSESYSVSGPIHGYSNVSYPLVTDVNSYLSVTYYDNYDFRSAWLGDYTYYSDALTNTSLTGTYTQVATDAENQKVVGLVTGSKTKVLDGGVTGGYTWLKTIQYYDSKYRLIQVKADNYKGGIERTSNLLDFTGKVLKSKLTFEERDVMWKDKIGATVAGNKITRTVTGSSWSVSGAASEQQLPAGQDGWMEVVASETNLYRMVGLSDANTDANFTSIDYAWSMTNTGQLMIYENGTSRGTFGTYVSGDILRIERTGTSVKYYKNGILKHSSAIASSTLLIVDAALYDLNSTVAGVRTSFSANSKFIQRTFEYDHAGRLVKTWHQIDAGGTNVLLSKNEYNELGQLVDKKLHSTLADGSNNKQSVDYRYNIRGWLTSMNNASLIADATNDDATDYFGMSLSYNTVDTDLANTALYNGNIAAMKWSNYPGTGTTKQKGYTYTYDAMNRIAGSTFKEKTSSWAAAANYGFGETGYTYDLNGNIKTMQRNDKRGTAWMDNMTYDYGVAGSTQSNRLLKVSDAGDKFAGFVDDPFNNATSDYTYDVNGNITRDLNKGIGTSLADATNIITYNYLNLPETITKGGNNVRYIYDATGRKLSQVVTFGTTQKQTDYVGEFTYENDALQYISHEEGRIAIAATKLIYTDACENLSSVTAANANTALSLVTINGTKYINAKATVAGSGNGIFPIGSIPFNVVAGERYRVHLKGYRTGTSPAYLLVKVNGTAINSPGTSLPSNATSESWVEQIVTISTSGTLQAGAVWNTVTLNENLYVNEFEITKLTADAYTSLNLVTNGSAESLTNFAPNQNAILSPYSTGAENYLKVTCNQTTSSPGFLTSLIPVTTGKKYQLRLKGYRSTNTAYLYVVSNTGTNVLWLTTLLPSGSANENWVAAEFTVPAGITGVKVGALWSVAALNETMYINDVQLYPIDEATQTYPQTAPEYQYNLKDHLGNVRLTFTTKQETETSLATMELASRTKESAKFLRYDKVRIVNTSPLFDHTNGTANGSCIRLSGVADERIGLEKTLAVGPGDVINMEVYAKYLDKDQINWTPLLASIVNPISSGNASAVTDGLRYAGNSTTPYPYTGVNNTSTSNGSGPKAYLNYIMFDKDFNVILPATDPSQTNYVQVPLVAKESGANLDTNPNGVPHALLSASVTVKQPGYMFVYLSNEEGTPVEVYFDDFKVDHIKSPVIQTDDYYPFGLQYNSYTRENSFKNQYLYNGGAERQDELSLEIDLTKFRAYDPAMGRWWQVDPKADKEGQEIWSPYNYAFNNPIRYNDPDGDCIPCLMAQLSVKYSTIVASFKSSSSTGAVNRLMTNSSSTGQKSNGGTGSQSTSINKVVENKTMATMGDAKIVADNTAKNTKVLTNEVSKDGLTLAKAVGTGLEVTGVGVLPGAIINTVAGALDETRQVAFEGKSASEAGTTVAIDGAIDLAFGGMGSAAKSTVEGAGKQTFDKAVDAYDFSFSNLFQWVSDKIRSTDDKKK